MNVDELIAALDERCAREDLQWDMYRTHRGDWYARIYRRGVSAREDPEACDAADDSLLTVLQKLLAVKRLPVIPKRPVRQPYEIHKAASGSLRWEVAVNGIAWRAFRTKREALEYIAPMGIETRAAQDLWDQKFASLVHRGAEGVDFRWEV